MSRIASDAWGFDELRLALAGEARLDASSLEGHFARIEQLLVDATLRCDRRDLQMASGRLKRIYEVLAGACPDDYEQDRSYQLGRIVELVELSGAACGRTEPKEVVELLDRPEFASLFDALAKGPRKSKDLEERLGWDKATISRRLKRTNELGLVTSHMAGQNLVSRLTMLGEQVLAKHGERRPARPEPVSCWNCEQLARPVDLGD